MLVYLILIYFISVSAVSDTKYIDLLPEKEKQEFLERIARRILDEVEPGVRGVPEVTNDELNVHDDFVKKILKEEKDNLRKNGKAITEKGNLTEQGNLAVKPLQRKGSKKNKKGYIDLTLRSRTKRDGLSKEKGDTQNKDDEASNLYEDIQVKSKLLQVENKVTNSKTEATIEDLKVSTTETKLEVTDKINTEDFLENTEKSTQKLEEENQSYSQTNGSLNIKINNNTEIKIKDDATVTTQFFTEEQTESSTQATETAIKNDSYSQDKTTGIEKESLIVNIRRNYENDPLDEVANDDTQNKLVEKKILRTGYSAETAEDLTAEIHNKDDNKLPVIPIINKVSDVSTAVKTETNLKSTVLTTQTPEVFKTAISSDATVTETKQKLVISDEPTKPPEVKLAETTENHTPATRTEDNNTSAKIDIKIDSVHTDRDEKALGTKDIKYKLTDRNKEAPIDSEKNSQIENEKISTVEDTKIEKTTENHKPATRTKDNNTPVKIDIKIDSAHTDRDEKALGTKDTKYKLTDRNKKAPIDSEKNSKIESEKVSITEDTKIENATNLDREQKEKSSNNKHSIDEATKKNNKVSILIEKNNDDENQRILDTKDTKIKKDTIVATNIKKESKEDTKTEKETNVDKKTDKDTNVDTKLKNDTKVHTNHTDSNLYASEPKNTEIQKDSDDDKSKSQQENQKELRNILRDLETLHHSKSYKMAHSRDKIISASAEHLEKNHDTPDGLNKHIDFYGPHLRFIDLEDIESENKKENTNKIDEVKAGSHIKNDNTNKIYEIKFETEVTTEKIKALTPTPIDVGNIVDSMERFKHKIKKKDNLHYDTADRLRHTVKEPKIEANGKLGVKLLNKIIPHKVYEIPANEPPFKKVAKKEDLNKEQPKVVPIYNYSPNNAFYNGINNQGPNPTDLKSEIVPADKNNIERTANFRMDYFKPNHDSEREFKISYSDQVKNGDNSINDIISGNFLNNDEDNIERCKNRTKNIKKEDNFKDQIREARLFMFGKKYFSPGKQMNYTLKWSSEESSDKTRSGQNHQLLQENSNIGIDYYFPNTHEPYDRAREVYKKQRDTLSDIIKRINQLIGKKVYLVSPNANKHPIINTVNLRNEKGKEDQPKLDLEEIKKILDITPAVDLIPTMNKLLQMKEAERSRFEELDLEIYIDVLSDMIQSNNRGLEIYDWIGTAVDIQGAIAKIISLAEQVLKKRYINPLDYELLKYIVYLHKQAVKSTQKIDNLRSFLPKTKHSKKKFLTQKGLFVREWLYRINVENVIRKHDIYKFQQFLKKLQNKLFELHTAIKHIAEITTYHNQHWFKNLKELYLDTSKTKTLELLLHMITVKVLDSIEKNSTKVLKEDYLQFIEKNPKEFEKVKKDLAFVLKIIEFMDKNVN